MMWINRLTPCAALAFGLAACASDEFASECADADWRAIGEADGEAGEPDKTYRERAKRCRKYDVVADAEAYEAGRTIGLARYCTAASGFEHGRLGHAYHEVCPFDVAPVFLTEYELGRQLYTLTHQHDDAVEKFERAMKGLETHRYDLQRAVDRYNENTLTEEDRTELRNDMRNHRREIEQLETDIPLLEVETAHAREQLDEFRAFLDARDQAEAK